MITKLCISISPKFSLCFSLFFLVMVIVLLHYAHVIERRQNCVLNTASLSTGWICSAGLIMVGNFQVRAVGICTAYIAGYIHYPFTMQGMRKLSHVGITFRFLTSKTSHF